MGEATYYFMAKFDNRENAKNGMNKIKQYLTDQKKAYDYWRSHRSKGTTEVLLKKYPLAMSFNINSEKLVEYEDARANNLAGSLINTTDSFSKCLKIDGKNVLYTQEVWEYDNWEHLIKFAKSLKGCLDAIYD